MAYVGVCWTLHENSHNDEHCWTSLVDHYLHTFHRPIEHGQHLQVHA